MYTCRKLKSDNFNRTFANVFLQLSSELGSDAFYWFTETCDFEADMFTPVFLRLVDDFDGFMRFHIISLPVFESVKTLSYTYAS